MFKKETNYTVVGYLTRYRIHMALKLLRDSRCKVYEVAGMVGYKDVAYFGSTFKKQMQIGRNICLTNSSQAGTRSDKRRPQSLRRGAGRIPRGDTARVSGRDAAGLRLPPPPLEKRAERDFLAEYLTARIFKHSLVLLAAARCDVYLDISAEEPRRLAEGCLAAFTATPGLKKF